MIETLYENSEDWLKHAIQTNLLHAKKKDQIALLQSALMDAKIQRALEQVAAFHSTRISSHKDPTLPIQQLLFLLDLGFDTSIPQIQSAIDQILAHKDDNGVYYSMINVPKQFGGTGEDGFSWCLCDAPNLMIALIIAGVSYEEHIKRRALNTLFRFTERMASLARPLLSWAGFEAPAKRTTAVHTRH